MIKILGVVGFIAFSSGTIIGEVHGRKAVKADWNQTLLDAKAEVRKEEVVKLQELQIQLDAANTERLTLAADLATEQSKVKIKYRTITKEIPAHVPPNTETCNYDLDIGLIRLLNNAARGGAAVGHTASADSAPR